MFNSAHSADLIVNVTTMLGSVHLKSVGGGGASEFRIGFRGGGHVNSACVTKSPRLYIFK